jgi:hypothetical protein
LGVVFYVLPFWEFGSEQGSQSKLETCPGQPGKSHFQKVMTWTIALHESGNNSPPFSKAVENEDEMTGKL